jgi:restriction system protein
MKQYNRVMLGRKSVHAAQCFAEGFIGAGYNITENLSGHLSEEWRLFNERYIPVWLASHPGKSKIAAGLACGMLWTICKGLKQGDVILSPDGSGSYRVGTIVSDYEYLPDAPLPHRRKVQWMDIAIERSAMSEALQRSTGSIGTTCDITGFAEEIERLIGGIAPVHLVSSNPEIEDPYAFSLEKHLEDFLVANWEQTELGKTWDIYTEEGEKVGQQYPTDVGPIDLLAISKDKKKLLVIELKRGRASDVVVGQILRYIGYVQDQLCDVGQTVQGVIIALEDDPKLRRALMPVPFIEFYRYQMSFKLVKG